MRWLKWLIPPKGRLFLRIILWRSKDLFSGTIRKFPSQIPERQKKGATFPTQIMITQPINKSEWAENKIHNLKLAVSTFQDLSILPGEIFSFWHHVGNPSKKAGYKVGINIIQNKLDFDYGGGLCQLSGLLYHLALSAGLDIIERHPHSVDLYTDETRYTPLGADATTVFGRKDLRLRNNLTFPFCFRFDIHINQITGSICAPEKIRKYRLEFKKEVIGEKEKVKTIRYSKDGTEHLTSQIYRISDHDQVI